MEKFYRDRVQELTGLAEPNDQERGTLDRPLAFLPEMAFDDFSVKTSVELRPWCDILWQCCGLEKSHHYDAHGNWHE